MTGLRTTAVFSTVQILVICAGLGFGSVGWGTPSAGDCSRFNGNYDTCSAESGCEYNTSNDICRVASAGGKGGNDACQEAKRRTAMASKDANDECSKAGYDSTAACIKTSIACKSSGVTPGTVDTSALSQLFGAQINPTADSSNAGNLPKGNTDCPQEAASDYYSEAKDIQGQIADAKKESADLDKEIATDKKDADTKLADGKKEIAQAIKDLNKLTTENNADQRKAAAEALAQQQKDTTQLQQLNAAITKKQGEVASYESNYAQQMLQYTDQLNQLTCLSQVKAARAEMTKQGLFNATGGIGTSVASANSQKAALQASWDTCISGLKLKRTKMEQDRATYLQQAQLEIQNDNSAIDQANQTLKSDSDNAAAALSDLKTTLTQAQQSTMTDEQNTQADVQNTLTTIQQQQAALQKKQAVLTTRISQLQQSLDNLGPAPRKGVTASYREANAKIEDFKFAQDAEILACCTTAPGGIKGQGLDPNDPLCKSGSIKLPDRGSNQ